MSGDRSLAQTWRNEFPVEMTASSKLMIDVT
jgi:hypothetical protein